MTALTRGRNIRLPNDLWTALEAEAAKQDRSVNQLVRIAVRLMLHPVEGKS